MTMRVVSVLLMLLSAGPALAQSAPTNKTFIYNGTEWVELRPGEQPPGAEIVRYREQPEPPKERTFESTLDEAWTWTRGIGWTPFVLFGWLMVCLKLRGSSEVSIDDLGNDSEHWDDERNDGGRNDDDKDSAE